MAERVILEVGEPLPKLVWRDAAGTVFALSDDLHGGRPSLLLLGDPGGMPEADLAALAERHEAFQAAGVQVLAVTADSGTEAGRALDRPDLPFPLIAAPDFAATGGGRVALIADETGRVERRFADLEGAELADQALAHCRARRAGEQAVMVTRQPPVLIVERLIDPDHCRDLIRAWEQGQRYEGGVASATGGKHDVNQSVKVRQDIALPDQGPEAQKLFAVFRRRLFPEVRKVFKFPITRAETLRLGCYDAAAGGLFRAHRDDSSRHVAHRRFAMSLFLNTGDYEGGHLCFPEYGPQLYAPATGSAVIFSCSLLHAVSPVTDGRRFGLFGFFHGEAEEARRRAQGAPYEYSQVDRPPGPAAPPRRLPIGPLRG